MKSGYKFRPFQPEDLAQIEHSMCRLYSSPLQASRDYLRWKYVDNPYSERPLIVVAEYEGNVAGQYTYTPLGWRNSATGSEETILAPGGAFVLPEHRCKGLFSRMMSFGWEWLSPDYRGFLNTSSTSNSARIYEKFGAYPLADRLFLDSCSYPGLMHYCLNYRKKNQSKVKHGEYSGILVTDEVFGEDMSRIASRRTLSGSAVELKRDGIFYGWRYRNPAKKYTFYYDGYPGEITGYVVVSHNSNNLRGYIVDYGQTDAFSLGRILRCLKERSHYDILSIYEFCVDEEFLESAAACGFKKDRAVRCLEQKVTPFYPLFLIKTGESDNGWFWDGLDLRMINNWRMMGAVRELD